MSILAIVMMAIDWVDQIVRVPWVLNHHAYTKASEESLIHDQLETCTILSLQLLASP
jgi:hypothetical protein